MSLVPDKTVPSAASAPEPGPAPVPRVTSKSEAKAKFIGAASQPGTLPLADINHQLLMALMEIIPERIYFKDRESRFIAVNKALIEYFGKEKAADLLGRTTFDVLQSDYAQKTREDDLRIMATGEAMVGFVEKKVFPDGRMNWASTTKVPLRDHLGETIGVCGISRDVSKQQEQAEKLREYATALGEKQTQMDGELELARQVQRALLPNRYPVFPPTASEEESALGFSYRYEPMGKVGGDFFTVIPLGSRQAGVFICDVMGHGVHAALITAMQRTLVDDLLPFGADPGAFLAEANRLLYPFFERMKTPIYITGLYATIDVESGKVRFATASHPAPLVISQDGTVRLLGAPRRVPASVPLGFLAESPYEVLEDTLVPGDRLLFYTDGLRDLGDEAAIGLDDAMFLSLVGKCAPAGKGFLDALLDAAKRSAGVEAFLDDVCLVEVLFRGSIPGGGLALRPGATMDAGSSSGSSMPLPG